ncbi:retrovirus-related pol polyprotein from transposon TNT 1-94 [Tanacetum coccineum]|uniref:Retrovirus-related pol polyprotein from transposon TNT 1-94 n=1 Tax=Tanacetum coccineum TaxID=301880 RepID=A0ABQ5CNA8_9ASTR
MFQRSRDDKNGKSDRKCFRCGDPNHHIGECPKPPKDKNQRAFVGGSWSDCGEEDDEKAKDETCLVAQASSEICLGIDLEPGTISNDSLNIDNVEHVDNLRFNLLSVCQICDNKCRVTFSEHDSEITKEGDVIGENIKNAMSCKEKSLDDLHNNAFSGTNMKDAVEHIEYFLRIVDPIDLPNINQDKLRVLVFPISLVGDA